MLTPRELEKLNVFVTSELARRRQKRGLKLNHPEAVSILADHILEGARDGKTVPELMSSGKKILSKNLFLSEKSYLAYIWAYKKNKLFFSSLLHDHS